MITFFNFKQNKQLGTHLPLFLQPIELESYLEKHHNLIGRLKLAYSDKNSWDNKLIPCVKKLALVCGHLPYTANGIFSDCDGLFKAGITAATHAIEIMESSVQLEKNIMAQHLLQGRLKASAALAGLCSFLDVFDHRLKVIEKQKNQNIEFFHISEANHVSRLAYQPLAMPYNDWIEKKLSVDPTIELQLHWNTQPTSITQPQQNQRLFLSRHILLPETLSWLTEAGPLPLLELLKCLTIDSDLENLPSSVFKAKNLGVYRACLLERERMGAKLGEILEPDGWQETLIRILRTRILNDWEINAKDSPLRKGADGLFLFWPDVCPILIEDMKTFGLTDLPTDPDIWAGCLLSSGITLSSKNQTATCQIAVTPNAKPREAVKLSDAYFFSSGRSLYAKTVKRPFEVDLALEQSLGLSQLTREALELADTHFTDKLPDQLPSQAIFVWQCAKEFNQPELQSSIQMLSDYLTQHPETISFILIDEGLFLSEDFIHKLNIPLSYEHLVLALLTGNLIYQTDKKEPLWVTHSDQLGALHRGVILKPDLLEAQIHGQKLGFNDLFKQIHNREANPNFTFKQIKDPMDQLSLNFDEVQNG